MLGVKRNILVNAAPDKVFSYLADFTRHHEWNGWRDFRLKPTFPGYFNVGNTFHASANLFSTGWGTRTYRRVETLTEVFPSIRLAFDSTITPGRNEGNWRVSFDVEPADSGARVTMRYDTIYRGLEWLILPLFVIVLPLVPLSLCSRRLLIPRATTYRIEGCPCP